MNKRFDVFILITIIILIALTTLHLIKKQQKKIAFIHPGWILVIVSSIYALFVPIAYLFLGDDLYKAYIDVSNNFQEDYFIKIIGMYTILLLSFLYSQGLIIIISKIKQRSKYYSGRAVKINSVKPIKKHANKIVTVVLLIIGVYLIYIRFNAVGGFVSAITLSRRDLADAIADTGLFSRYEYFFQGFFILNLSSILTEHSKKTPKIAFIISLISYTLYLLLMGVRLNIIVLLLGLFFVLYTSTLVVFNKKHNKVFNSKFWYNNKKKILVFTFIAFLFFGWYTFQRANVRSTLIGESIDFNKVNYVSLLFPSEFSTGYVPGLIMMNRGWNTLGPPYWQKFFPSSVLALLGVEQSMTVAKELAWNLHGLGRAPVYTITLPIDIYLGTSSMVLIFVVGSLIYLVFWKLLSSLSKKGYWGTCFSALIFLNLFYVIRVEAANWFPRIWQSSAILFITWLTYLLLSRIEVREQRNL